MGTKVTLGKHENSGGSMWFKLVKGMAHDCEPAPFSDSYHNSLQMCRPGNPHTFDVPNEVVLHINLGGGNFICN